MKITLTNNFHNTSAAVIPDEKGNVSARAMKSASAKLCGCSGCTCGSFRGPISASDGKNYSYEQDFDGSARFFEV